MDRECYQCGATQDEHPNGRCQVFQLPPPMEVAPQRVYQLCFGGRGSKQVWRTREEAEKNRESFDRMVRAASPNLSGWTGMAEVIELEVVP